MLYLRYRFLYSNNECVFYSFSVVSSPEHVCDQNRAQVPGAVPEQRRSVMDFSEPENTEVKKEYITREIIDDLVLKTLGVIRLLVDK